MDENCLFCKIGAKKIPSKLVYEDDDIFAFEDISPQSPTHILICPRKHFAALHDASRKIKSSSANCSSLPPNLPPNTISSPAIAPSSTTGPALASPSCICICTFSAAAISAGPRVSGNLLCDVI